MSPRGGRAKAWGMSLARPLHRTAGDRVRGTTGRESRRSTRLPGPRAPRGRAPLLLTYRAEAEPPPPPPPPPLPRPSCSWVSRRGGGEGGSGAGPVEDDAPPRSGRCCESAVVPAARPLSLGVGSQVRPQHPTAPPQATGTPGYRHPIPGHRHPRPPAPQGESSESRCAARWLGGRGAVEPRARGQQRRTCWQRTPRLRSRRLRL